MPTRLKNLFLDLLFPVYCMACGKEGLFLCQSCADTLPLLPPVCFKCAMLTPENSSRPAGHTCDRCMKKTPIRVFLSPFSYRHPLVSHILHEFKYRRIRHLSPIMANLLASYLNYYKIPLSKQTIIMPIPLHPRKERVRGFNQADLLAHDLAKHLSLTIDTQTLVRTAYNTPQTRLHAQERRANVENIFSIRNREKVYKKIVVLLDDVKTTGSTLEQAAHILKQAGAKEIWTITFAH